MACLQCYYHNTALVRGAGWRGWQWETWLTLLMAACVLTSATTAAADCSSGVLQLKQQRDNFDACNTGPLTARSGTAVCMAALRVRVKAGVIKVVPLELGTYNFTAYGFDDLVGPFNCKDFNASGLFDTRSTSKARIMLYNNNRGPLSTLAKTGPRQVTLTTATTATLFGDTSACSYHYTVVAGCVFGIKAAPAAKPPAAPCPAGFVRKTGRFHTPFCAPCLPGSHSPKPGNPCKPCPPGTSSNLIGATSCGTCTGGYFSSKPGAIYCRSCSDTGPNKWTDGKRCAPCPKDSYVTPSVELPAAGMAQCVRCQAAKRCCTVGWSKDCPKCTAGSSTPSTHTSTFALESASRPACLANIFALCSPQLNITISGSCVISIGNLNNAIEVVDFPPCAWSAEGPIVGPRARLTDLQGLTNISNPNIISVLPATLTAAGPHLNIHLPSPNCTLRYRALTPAAATLLGITPAPTPAPTTCPPGFRLAATSKAKPGPCLPCPPGTYNTGGIPSSPRLCTRCQHGAYTNRYGSTACKKCPAGRVAYPGSSGWCKLCDLDEYPWPDGSGCAKCPKPSAIFRRGAGVGCLANAYGSACCAAGNCKGQVPCKGLPIPKLNTNGENYTAVLQLVSKSLPQPACKKATLLTCLPANGKIILTATDGLPKFYLDTYGSSSACGTQDKMTGRYFSTSSAFLSLDQDTLVITSDSSPAPPLRNPPKIDVAYGMVSNRSQGTVTIYQSPYVSDWDKASVPPARATPGCSATFKLASGYAFDLSPPKGAKCDPTDEARTYAGRTFCSPCPAGKFLDGKRKRCQACPKGYYSDKAGATACKPCPAGSACMEAGMSKPEPCWFGQYSSKSKQAKCAVCPANTYTAGPLGKPTTKCTPCPKGTVAPNRALACGVPWDTAFLA